MAFAAPAIPYVVAGLGYAQYKNQGAQGKFNQDVQNRNAEIAKQEAQAIQDQLVFYTLCMLFCNYKDKKSVQQKNNK
jgi:hypothetical protein